MELIISLITAVAAAVVAAWVIVHRETGALRQSIAEESAQQRKALLEAISELRAATAPVAPAPAPSVEAPAAPGPAVVQPVVPPAPAPISPAPAVAEEVTPEILMVISAAVAAFFGKKAKIRRVRPAGLSHGGSVWAQQGRAFVQASHNLPVHRQ